MKIAKVAIVVCSPVFEGASYAENDSAMAAGTGSTRFTCDRALKSDKLIRR